MSRNGTLGNRMNALSRVPLSPSYPAIKRPKPEPPPFRGAGKDFRDRLELFRTYGISNGFFPAFANRVDLHVIDPFTAFQSL